ncbi:MAG: DUF1080 domain-containing protein [Flavobacteriaceae bacterium]|nr:DUF1080 domain-containing protein [Flavobacteriaceae bacterium]
MVKKFLILFLIIVTCNFTHAQNTLTKKEKKDGWKLLFDGETTNGWRNYGKQSISGWDVVGGVLQNSGVGSDHGSDIISNEIYEDFEFYFEWKIASKSNSGVFYHVNEIEGKAIYSSAPEFQLLDDTSWPDKFDNLKSGANYAMNAPIRAKVKPLDEFNTSRIIVKDDQVEHWLNGVKVVSYKLWSDSWKQNVSESKWKNHPEYGIFKKGHIGLQDHGGMTMFRNMKIKNTTDKGKSIFNEKNLKGWKIHGTEKWYVNNSELICESGEDKEYGYLATNKKYKDFILRLKFKQESDGNSGVFIRSSIAGTKISGWQVEVAPKGHDTGGIYESYGRGWLYKIPENKEDVLKEGEWNEMIIKVKGDRTMVWLNNELMTDLVDEKIGEGFGVVALQIHSGGGIKVRWKDLFIKEL